MHTGVCVILGVRYLKRALQKFQDDRAAFSLTLRHNIDLFQALLSIQIKSLLVFSQTFHFCTCFVAFGVAQLSSWGVR